MTNNDIPVIENTYILALPYEWFTRHMRVDEPERLIVVEESIRAVDSDIPLDELLSVIHQNVLARLAELRYDITALKLEDILAVLKNVDNIDRPQIPLRYWTYLHTINDMSIFTYKD